MPSEITKPHVLIVGAGLAGLTLAQCLRKQGISFEIFERDANAQSRRQGWAIGIHTMMDDLESFVPSDLPDLRASAYHLLPLPLNTQICLYLRPGSGRIGVQDTPETPCLRLNRTRFRQWLSMKIPINWGKIVKSVENTDDRVSVHFEDGTTATGDIVIGADGVNSIVREHLLKRPNSEVLNLLPTAAIIGETVLSGDAMERQLNLGHSCYTVIQQHDGYALFIGLNQAGDDGTSGNYYWLLMKSDDTIGDPDHWLHNASKEEKLNYAKKITASLEPQFREPIEATPVSGVYNMPFVLRDAEIYSLPAGRVALLGDAAHPMTPFRGEGGVHAIRDALALSKVLGRIDKNDSEGITTAIAAYHSEILKRGVEAVQKSRVAHKPKGEKPVVWGHTTRPIPEEHISLDSFK